MMGEPTTSLAAICCNDEARDLLPNRFLGLPNVGGNENKLSWIDVIRTERLKADDYVIRHALLPFIGPASHNTPYYDFYFHYSPCSGSLFRIGVSLEYEALAPGLVKECYLSKSRTSFP